MITPDYTNLECTPSGMYNTQVHRYEMGPSQRGRPRILWWLKIKDGPMKNRMIFLSTVLTGKPAIYLKRFLQILDSRYTDGPFEPDDFIGKSLSVKVSMAQSTTGPGLFQVVKPVARLEDPKQFLESIPKNPFYDYQNFLDQKKEGAFLKNKRQG